MRIACTGIHGNIGSFLVERGAIPLDCDVTDEKDVRSVLKKASPDIVIHAAAKSSPTWCEEHEEEASNVNFKGAWNVARACSDAKIPMVALSTDYVFTGQFMITRLGILRGGPYPESYRRPYPVNYYGMTKFAMEALMFSFDNVKIVRTSNVFWKTDERVTKYVAKAFEQEKVFVPAFQYRSFMHIQHFAESLERYCSVFEKMPKILHLSGSKTVNWYTFVREFAKATNVPEDIVEKLKPMKRQDKWPVKNPKKAGLKTDLSAKLGFTQYDYLDGLELLK